MIARNAEQTEVANKKTSTASTFRPFRSTERYSLRPSSDFDTGYVESSVLMWTWYFCCCAIWRCIYFFFGLSYLVNICKYQKYLTCFFGLITKACCFHAIWWLWIRGWRWLPWSHSKILGLDTWLLRAAILDISRRRFASNSFWCLMVFFFGGEEIPVTIVDCLKALCNFYAFHLISLNFACFVLLARHLVDLQPRYAYTTWAPKAKFCLQDQAAWNISRAASPKRGSQGLGRCTLSPRIGSKPYLINGCGHTDLYWLLEAFTLLYWGSRCLSQLQLSGMKLAWFS